jgi:hypothetical protein
MRYLMFIKHTEDYRNREIPAGLYEAMGQFVEAAMKSGAIIDTAGLKPTADGKALEYATRFMELHRQHWPEFEGECEVRPLEDNP